ncbi:MAG: immunity 17 family protein [Bacteroidaceae bacterium]|nr:immunity 17 family protein [Bacteroidaceae bacterium]
MLHYVVQLIFLLTGITALSASVFDWEWFFTADNASFLVRKLGRNGARWIYGIIGLIFIVAAIYFYSQIPTV